jgi:hypothetical protein
VAHITVIRIAQTKENLADDAVFTHSDGKAFRDFRNACAIATEFAAVPGLSFHDLRRTATRNLRRPGIREAVIIKVGG